MIKKWLTTAADRSFRFVTAVLMRQAVARLRCIDDHALHQAGLSRRAVAAFLAAPLGTEPGHFFTKCTNPQSPVARRPAATLQQPVAPEPARRGKPDARAGPDRQRTAADHSHRDQCRVLTEEMP